MGLRVATYQGAGTQELGSVLQPQAACSLGLLSAPPLCGSIYFLCLVHDAQLNGAQTPQSPQAEMWGCIGLLSFLTVDAGGFRPISSGSFPSVLPACPQQIPDGCKSPDEGAISLVLCSFLIDWSKLYVAGEVLCFQCFWL